MKLIQQYIHYRKCLQSNQMMCYEEIKHMKLLLSDERLRLLDFLSLLIYCYMFLSEFLRISYH